MCGAVRIISFWTQSNRTSDLYCRSTTGLFQRDRSQRWGNPIYDWEHMKEQNYQFWVDRIGYSNKLLDIIRIDHFRAFDTYWKIPATCFPTAIDGEWIEAPGYEVIDTLQKELPGLNLVAEDLGLLRPEVLRIKGSLPSERNENPYLFSRNRWKICQGYLPVIWKT